VLTLAAEKFLIIGLFAGATWCNSLLVEPEPPAGLLPLFTPSGESLRTVNRRVNPRPEETDASREQVEKRK
jgi:hypothetical protein